MIVVNATLLDSEVIKRANSIEGIDEDDLHEELGLNGNVIYEILTWLIGVLIMPSIIFLIAVDYIFELGCRFKKAVCRLRNMIVRRK